MASSTETSFADDGDLMVGFPSFSQRQSRRRRSSGISGSGSSPANSGSITNSNPQHKKQADSKHKERRSSNGYVVLENGDVTRRNISRKMSFESISSKAESNVKVAMFDTTDIEIHDSESEYTYVDEDDEEYEDSTHLKGENGHTLIF